MVDVINEIKPAKLSIGEFRSAVDSLNWTRNDLHGSTQSEFTRTNVPLRLSKHMDNIRELLKRLPLRFTDDITKAQQALNHAQTMIDRWNRIQANHTSPTKRSQQ